jgi:hypothetical protein
MYSMEEGLSAADRERKDNGCTVWRKGRAQQMEEVPWVKGGR